MSPESSAATAAAASLALSALLATHEPQIKLLAEKLGMNPILFEDSSEDSSSRCAAISQFLPSKSPRLFLLRHLLSNKLSVDEALPPARFALDWFQQHSELITKIRKYSSAAASSVNATIALGSTIQQFQVYGDHKSTLDGDPIVYVRIGLCNPKGLMDAITDFNQLLLSFTLQRIPALDVCDGLSLEKNRLVKAITVLDFKGVSLLRGNDSRFSKLIGESSKLNEKLFPQLLGISVFVNVPSFFYWTFGLIKPLMSKRAVEKMRFCPGNASGKPLSSCPYLTARLPADRVPTFLGGTCNCSPGGCIAGVPNSQTAPIDEIDEETGMACITVGPRSVQKLEFPCIAGVKLLYSFRVQDRKVELSGDYHDGNCNNNNGSVSSSSVVILDKRWLNQEDGIVSGEWVNNTATTTTTTTIVFSLDNTHSLMRSKRVFYKIQFES